MTVYSKVLVQCDRCGKEKSFFTQDGVEQFTVSVMKDGTPFGPQADLCHHCERLFDMFMKAEL